MMKKWYHMILQTHKGDAIATGPRGIQGTRKHVIIFCILHGLHTISFEWCYTLVTKFSAHNCTLSRLNDVIHWWQGFQHKNARFNGNQIRRKTMYSCFTRMYFILLTWKNPSISFILLVDPRSQILRGK